MLYKGIFIYTIHGLYEEKLKMTTLGESGVSWAIFQSLGSEDEITERWASGLKEYIVWISFVFVIPHSK